MLFHSTKYDGSLHYRFPVEVVHQTPTLLVTYRGAGVAMHSYRGRWASSRQMLCLHWTDRHWNLCVHWTHEWQPLEHYVNIATPADWSDGTLRLIDLDLDLILPAAGDAGRRPKVILDDADEFDEHRARCGYPASLVAQCLEATVSVAAAMARPDPLFDGRLFGWRPGQELPSLEDPVAASR